MKKIIVYILIVFFPCWAIADDPGKFVEAYENAKGFIKTNEYAKALELYLWIDENANETDMVYHIVKIPAYSYWGVLASVYPKAMIKFKEVRDRKITKIESGNFSEKLFTDIRFINTSIGEQYITVELFEYLDQVAPEYAKQVYNTTEEELILFKRYRLARKYLGDPLARLNNSIYEHEKLIELDESLREKLEPVLIDEVIRIITILENCDERSLALTIKDRALEVISDKKSQDLLRQNRNSTYKRSGYKIASR